MNKFLHYLYIFSALYFLSAVSVLATDYTSSSFKVLDPVFQTGGGGEMTSASFKLIGSVGQIAVGTSSASSFKVCSGFLCYPAPSAAAAKEAAAAAVAVSHGGILESLLEAFNLRVPVISVKPCASKADFNCDRKVGLADLSIFLYFAPRSVPNPVDLNNDGVVDTKDFSMLLSSWNEKLLTFVPDSAPRRADLRLGTEIKDQFAFIGQTKVSEEIGEARDKSKEADGVKKISFLSGIKRAVSGAVGSLRGLFIKAVDLGLRLFR